MQNNCIELYLNFRKRICDRKELYSLLRLQTTSKIWKTIATLNPSGDPNNYHSNDHMLYVLAIALWLARRNDRDLSLSAQLACMMHDYGHSIGKLNDDENIKIACAGVDSILGHYDDSVRQKVKDLIKITRFPFLEENEPKTLEEQFIRDADLLYAMVEGPERISIRSKLNIEIGRDRNVSEEDLVEQTNFWSKCVMYTEQGKQIQQYFTDPEYKRVIC